MKTTTSQSGASWWQLCMVFALSLLLFVAIRWQPEPWLRAWIEEQTSQQGISLAFKHMQTDGFTVRMEQVSVHAAALAAPLEFDSLSVSPAWASLFGGSPAVYLQLSWQGQRAESLLNWQDNYIDIFDLEARLDISVLQALWQKYMALPVNLSGLLHVSGAIRLDMQSGRPLTGKLNADWKSASLEMADKNILLGDYELAMTVDETSAVWRWVLGGGKAVLVQAEGTLAIPAAVQQPWPVSGQARIEAGKDAGILSAMLGTAPLLFSLSGNMANPKLLRM